MGVLQRALLLVLTVLVSDVSCDDWNALCPKLTTLQSKITETLQKRSHSFSLLYHSYPPECQIAPPRHTRLLVFANQTEPVVLRCPLRHSSSIDVVIAPCSHSSNQRVFNTIRILGLAITTVFIMLQPKDREITPNIPLYANLPALKLTVYFHNKTEIRADIECNGYCTRNGLTLDTVRTNLHQPYQIHKKLFWDGMGRKISVFVWEPSENIPNFCPEYLRTRSLLFQNCWREMLSAYTVSRVHNFSAIFESYNDKVDKQIADMYEAQYIHTDYDLTNYNKGSILIRTEIASFEWMSYSAICCVLTRGDDETLDLVFWLQPFKGELWLLLLLLMSSYCVYSQIGRRDNKMFAMEICVSAYKFLAILIGDGNIRYSRIQLWLVFLGLAINLLYSNSLLSMSVKEGPPDFYNHLKPILKAGYKFIEYDFEVIKQLKYELVILGVPNVVETVIFCQNCSQVNTVAAQLAEKKLILIGTSNAKNLVNLYKNNMNQVQQLTYDCNVLLEELMPRHYMMVMYTVNRDWVGITRKQIVETGLQNAWIRWKNQVYSLKNRLLQKKRPVREDTIGSRKVELILGILLGLGINLATICFIIEQMSNFGNFRIFAHE